MHRFTLSLASVVVLLVSLIATTSRSTTAQEATPDATAMVAMAAHPIVGVATHQ
jgi:hypothetical protein